MTEDLKLVRLSKRITQFTLARITGITPSRISYFENGLIELRAEEVNRIGCALGVETQCEVKP